MDLRGTTQRVCLFRFRPFTTSILSLFSAPSWVFPYVEGFRALEARFCSILRVWAEFRMMGCSGFGNFLDGELDTFLLVGYILFNKGEEQ